MSSYGEQHEFTESKTHSATTQFTVIPSMLAQILIAMITVSGDLESRI